MKIRGKNIKMTTLLLSAPLFLPSLAVAQHDVKGQGYVFGSSAGYSGLAVCDSECGGISGFNFGGGINYWFKPDRRQRVEFRFVNEP